MELIDTIDKLGPRLKDGLLKSEKIKTIYIETKKYDDIYNGNFDTLNRLSPESIIQLHNIKDKMVKNTAL